MSQQPPHHKKAMGPGFTLIEVYRPADDRIAEAMLYLLARRAHRLTPPTEAPREPEAACGDAPREEPADQARRR